VTRARAAALLVLLTLSACTSSAPLNGGRASDDAATVVRGYVDAIKREDFAAATALRCSAARPQIDQARYKADFQGMSAYLGTIQSVAVSTVTGSKIVPIAELPGRIDVSFRLTTSKGEHEPLIGVTGIEGGKRVLCGWGTSEGSDLFPSDVAIINAAQTTKSSPRDLVAVRPPPGGKPYEDAAIPQDPNDAGQVEGWTRAWRLGDFGGVRISAVRYVGSDSALQSATAQLRRLQGIGAGSFTIPGAKGAIGIRAVTYSDLWLQDGRTPPFIDEVYAVFGSTLINVGVSNITTSSHEIAIMLMQEIAARAKA
jgi:hypothetical protein